jgi:predicted DNA-binding protein
MNTKTRLKLNDNVLAVRMPQILRDKLDKISHAQYKNSSEVVRQLIVEYIRQNQVALDITRPMQDKPKQRPAHEWDLREPTSPRPPSQQVHDTDWD